MGAWRSARASSGVACVMTGGTHLMPASFADNLATLQLVSIRDDVDTHQSCDSYSLLFLADAVPFGSALFGQGRGPILLQGVSCSGFEMRLDECSANMTSSCSHSEDAGVSCLPNGT